MDLLGLLLLFSFAALAFWAAYRQVFPRLTGMDRLRHWAQNHYYHGADDVRKRR